MSSRYRASDDHNNWWTLGSTVEFDGPEGQRLRGEIVRTSSNPTYLHVYANGRRYETDIVTDNMEMIWDDD